MKWRRRKRSVYEPDGSALRLPSPATNAQDVYVPPTWGYPEAKHGTVQRRVRHAVRKTN